MMISKSTRQQQQQQRRKQKKIETVWECSQWDFTEFSLVLRTYLVISLAPLEVFRFLFLWFYFLNASRDIHLTGLCVRWVCWVFVVCLFVNRMHARIECCCVYAWVCVYGCIMVLARSIGLFIYGGCCDCIRVYIY